MFGESILLMSLSIPQNGILFAQHTKGIYLIDVDINTFAALIIGQSEAPEKENCRYNRWT